MIAWREDPDRAIAVIGHLGSLVVRRMMDSKRHTRNGVIQPAFEVVVFGVGLRDRSHTMAEGKERALVASKEWILEAYSRLGLDRKPPVVVKPNPCPKVGLIGGCDWPQCDCSEP